MIDSDDPYQEILNIKLALDNYYVTKKSFFQDLKLVIITIFSLFTPKRMGHYLFIKLLKIEDNEKINLNKIVDNIRLKIARYKEVDKNDGRNRRVMILSDVIVIFFSLIFSSIVGNNFKTPLLLMEPDLYFILGTVLTVKLSTFYLCNLYRGMWRYTSITDVFHILFANFLAAFFLLCIYHFTSRFQNLSYEILFIDFYVNSFIHLLFKVVCKVNLFSFIEP